MHAGAEPKMLVPREEDPPGAVVMDDVPTILPPAFRETLAEEPADVVLGVDIDGQVYEYRGAIKPKEGPAQEAPPLAFYASRGARPDYYMVPTARVVALRLEGERIVHALSWRVHAGKALVMCFLNGDGVPKADPEKKTALYPDIDAHSCLLPIRPKIYEAIFGADRAK
jgi:hypothetical protein